MSYRATLIKLQSFCNRDLFASGALRRYNVRMERRAARGRAAFEEVVAMARYNFEKRLFTIPPEGIIETFVDARNMSISARPYDGDELRIEYYASEEYPYSASVRDGIVILSCPQDARPGGLGGLLGALFTQMNCANWQDMPIDIYVPRAYGGMLNLCTAHARVSAANLELASRFHALTSNAAIELRGVLATALELKTTNARVTLESVAAYGETDEQGVVQPALSRIHSSNGTLDIGGLSTLGPLECATSNASLRLHDVAVQGALNCATSNGSVHLDRVSVQEAVSVRTSNASIKLDRLLARDIDLSTNNGAIKGSIVGRLSDFAVDSRTSNGKNSLPAASDGPRRLGAHTSNASISIEFT